MARHKIVNGAAVLLSQQEEAERDAEEAAVAAAASSAAWTRIKAERDRRKQESGYEVAGKWFHSDRDSRIQQLGLKELGASIPPGIPWKTMDGSSVEMTPTLAAQIFAAAVVLDVQAHAAAEGHRAAMEAAEDPAAYDFSGGWPPAFGE